MSVNGTNGQAGQTGAGGTQALGGVVGAPTGQIPTADLQTFLAEAAAFAKSGKGGEMGALMAALGDGSIDAAGRQKLANLIAGGSPASTTFAKGAGEARAELNGVAYFTALHDTMSASFTELADGMAKSTASLAEQNALILRGLVNVSRNQVKLAEGMGEMSKAMGLVLRQPVRNPAAVQAGGGTGAQPVPRAFGPTAQAPVEGEGVGLTREDIFATMNKLFEKSVASGGEGRLPTGEDIGMAIVEFEQTQLNGQGGKLSAGMVAAIKAERSGK